MSAVDKGIVGAAGATVVGLAGEMQCEACGAAVSRWSASPLCPACHAVSGATLTKHASAMGDLDAAASVDHQGR